MRPTILVSVLTLLTACSRDLPSGSVAPAATPAKPSPPIVLTEFREFLMTDVAAQGGELTFRDTEPPCQGVSYAGQWTGSEEQPVPTANKPLFNHAFVPNVRHRFEGRVCMPVKLRTGMLEDAKSEASFKTVLINGKYVTAANDLFPLSGSLLFGEQHRNGPHIVIVSDAANPLVFMVTPEGYRHEAGNGTVATPGGKNYTFWQGR